MSVWIPVSVEGIGRREPTGLAFGPADESSIEAPRPCDEVPAGDDLPNISEEITFLSRSAAMSLGLPVLGISGTADAEQRVWMSEWKRYRDCPSPDGQIRYGVAVRLIVDIVSISGKIESSTLAAIAAEATLGNVQARVQLSVLGYTGDVPASASIQWAPLSVDNYATVLASAGALRALVQGASASELSPVVLAIETNTGADDASLDALGRVWALGSMAEGRSCHEAQTRLPIQFQSPLTLHAIVATYEALAEGAGCGDQRPGPRARVTAEALTGPFRLRRGLFG